MHVTGVNVWLFSSYQRASFFLSPRSGLPACMHLHHLASDDSMFKGCVLEISIPKDYKFGKWNPLPCTQSFGSTGWPSPQEMERSLIFKMLPAWALWLFCFVLFCYFQFWFCWFCFLMMNVCMLPRLLLSLKWKFYSQMKCMVPSVAEQNVCPRPECRLSPANRKQPFSISS